MKKLETLTNEQIAKFPLYVEKWLSIGLDTKPLNKPEIEKCLRGVYKAAGLNAPSEFVYLQSPLQGCLTAEKLQNPNSKKGEENQIYNAGYGLQDAGWLSFYDFFINECSSVENIELVKPLINLASLCGWWWPFENLVIITEKPVSVSLKNGMLHNETGMSIKYSDGFGVYALNGIRMTEAYVMTPAEDLSVTDIMKEQNVDIRRELLRKVGLSKFIKDTKAKILDALDIQMNGKTCSYQLLEVNLSNDITARVLKMDNPSIDAIHVEGVEDNCMTVKDALAWRNGFDKYVEPISLT